MSECELVGCQRSSYCKGLCKAHYTKKWLYGDVRYNGRLLRRKPIDYKTTESGCFESNSHTTNWGGYPEYHFNGKKYMLHRYIYEECFGLIPEGMIVRHKCDNRLCINSEHLELGTHADNMEDMTKRERQCRGGDSPFAKLTEKDIPVIRDLLREGVSTVVVAEKYNVSRTTIGNIKHNRNWTHVK
jgi:hypothetical protein